MESIIATTTIPTINKPTQESLNIKKVTLNSNIISNGLSEAIIEVKGFNKSIMRLDKNALRVIDVLNKSNREFIKQNCDFLL